MIFYLCSRIAIVVRGLFDLLIFGFEVCNLQFIQCLGFIFDLLDPLLSLIKRNFVFQTIIIFA
jgi:hypothetical protein